MVTVGCKFAIKIKLHPFEWHFPWRGTIQDFSRLWKWGGRRTEKTSHDQIRIGALWDPDRISGLHFLLCDMFDNIQWLAPVPVMLRWSSWSTLDSGLPSPLLILFCVLCHSKDKKSDRNLSISAPWFYNERSHQNTVATTITNHNQELSSMSINPLR